MGDLRGIQDVFDGIPNDPPVFFAQKVVISLEGKHLHEKDEDVSHVLFQKLIETLLLLRRLVLDLAICQGCLDRELLVKFGFRAVEVGLAVPVDGNLPVVADEVSIQPESLLRSDVDEIGLEYMAALAILAVVRNLEGQELFEDHKYFLLRYDRAAFLLVVNPRFERVVVVPEIASNGEDIFLGETKELIEVGFLELMDLEQFRCDDEIAHGGQLLVELHPCQISFEAIFEIVIIGLDGQLIQRQLVRGVVKVCHGMKFKILDYFLAQFLGSFHKQLQ